MSNPIQILTHRLTIRPVNIGDSEMIFKYRSDKLTNQYQGWIPETISDVHDFIKNRIATHINLPNTWFQMVLLKNENNEIIGDIGLHFLDSGGYQVEMGCTIDRSHQNKGYATEALRAIIHYLFNQLNKHRIICSIDPRNENSIKLVERLGFRKEGHFIKSLFINNEWVDDLIYAILKEEWLK